MNRVKAKDGVELYDRICARENIELAVKNASKDHAKDVQVQFMKAHPEEYIPIVERTLKEQSFKYSRFKTRDIMERGKKRHLCYSQTFPDRVIQHAVLQEVGPILLGSCIKDTYAAQVGKGTHRCSMNLRNEMREDPEGTAYYLKMDVHHYFDSIDRNILFRLIKRKIACRRTLDILHEFIFGAPGRKGLPVGLYSSQIFSTFYLSYFDHWCKETLRIKHYKRYMDDIVVMSDDKAKLHRIRKRIDHRLKTELKLNLKRNWCIRPVGCGLDFVGYVHHTTHTRLRKRNKIAYKRACRLVLAHRDDDLLEHCLASMRSYEGMAKWCDGRNLIKQNSTRVLSTINGAIAT